MTRIESLIVRMLPCDGWYLPPSSSFCTVSGIRQPLVQRQSSSLAFASSDTSSLSPAAMVLGFPLIKRRKATSIGCDRLYRRGDGTDDLADGDCLLAQDMFNACLQAVHEHRPAG